jgi:hypothetical protein
MQERTLISWPEAPDGIKVLTLFDHAGAIKKQVYFYGNDFEIYKNELAEGIYFFKIKNEIGLETNGKLVILK